MSCNSCGHIQCSCDSQEQSKDCCEGEDRFIAKVPVQAIKKPLSPDIQNAEIINSEISLDCNTPAAGCTVTDWAPTQSVRCQQAEGVNTGRAERLYQRINAECVIENAWFDSGTSSECQAQVVVNITNVSCGNVVQIEIDTINCS